MLIFYAGDINDWRYNPTDKRELITVRKTLSLRIKFFFLLLNFRKCTTVRGISEAVFSACSPGHGRVITQYLVAIWQMMTLHLVLPGRSMRCE
ncbi:hypothetical protein KCP69_26765 (plasmid) [Salmonella enterica subsp. enterica]|nr:hypothetical protein KCP69_26765 [Salmonella enterica subsp. enterica]